MSRELIARWGEVPVYVDDAVPLQKDGEEVSCWQEERAVLVHPDRWERFRAALPNLEIVNP